MAAHGVDRGSNSVLRDLVLVVESEPVADPDEVDRSVRQLRTELTDLDVHPDVLYSLRYRNTPTAGRPCSTRCAMRGCSATPRRSAAVSLATPYFSVSSPSRVTR